MTTTLLVIALEFPPIQAAGVFRPLRFVTHLPKFGIRPVVVTFNPLQLADQAVHVFNKALSTRVPTDTPIYLLDVQCIEPDRPRTIETLGDDIRGVRCATFEQLFAEINARHRIDAIWATCPPFNMAGLALAARDAFRKPLIVDMRDAWSQWGMVPFRTWVHYRLTRRKEIDLINAADAVVCVTEQLADMQSQLTGKPKEGFQWIPNAYDFAAPPPRQLNLAAQKTPLRVAYAGQFYFNGLHEDAAGAIPWYKKKPHRWLHYYATKQRWIYRSPYFFFRAWARLRATNPMLGNRLEFHYVGHVPTWLEEMAAGFGLREFCTWHGVKSKQDTEHILSCSDALLSTSIKVVDGEDYCLASKTFDYIAAGKIVLGFVCPGAQRDFLLQANISVLFDPDDVSGSARTLGEVVEHGVRRDVNTQFLETYSSLSTTNKLADLIIRLCRGANGGFGHRPLRAQASTC